VFNNRFVALSFLSQPGGGMGGRAPVDTSTNGVGHGNPLKSISNTSHVSGMAAGGSTRKAKSTPTPGVGGNKGEEVDAKSPPSNPRPTSVKSCDSDEDLSWLGERKTGGTSQGQPDRCEGPSSYAGRAMEKDHSGRRDSDDDSSVGSGQYERYKKNKKKSRQEWGRDRLDGEWRELKEKKEELFSMMRQMG
jgi:hypothetical protein